MTKIAGHLNIEWVDNSALSTGNQVRCGFLLYPIISTQALTDSLKYFIFQVPAHGKGMRIQEHVPCLLSVLSVWCTVISRLFFFQNLCQETGHQKFFRWPWVTQIFFLGSLPYRIFSCNLCHTIFFRPKPVTNYFIQICVPPRYQMANVLAINSNVYFPNGIRTISLISNFFIDTLCTHTSIMSLLPTRELPSEIEYTTLSAEWQTWNTIKEYRLLKTWACGTENLWWYTQYVVLKSPSPSPKFYLLIATWWMYKEWFTRKSNILTHQASNLWKVTKEFYELNFDFLTAQKLYHCDRA